MVINGNTHRVERLLRSLKSPVDVLCKQRISEPRSASPFPPANFHFQASVSHSSTCFTWVFFFFFLNKMRNRFYCLFWAHSIADINWCSNLFDFDCWTPGWFLICDWYFYGLVENWIDFWFLQSKLKVTKKTAERWSNWPKRSLWTSRLLIAVVIHIE